MNNAEPPKKSKWNLKARDSANNNIQDDDTIMIGCVCNMHAPGQHRHRPIVGCSLLLTAAQERASKEAKVILGVYVGKRPKCYWFVRGLDKVGRK
jgi:hypothetical protein